jgi:hypothetical protein
VEISSIQHGYAFNSEKTTAHSWFSSTIRREVRRDKPGRAACRHEDAQRVPQAGAGEAPGQGEARAEVAEGDAPGARVCHAARHREDLQGVESGVGMSAVLAWGMSTTPPPNSDFEHLCARQRSDLSVIRYRHAFSVGVEVRMWSTT